MYNEFVFDYKQFFCELIPRNFPFKNPKYGLRNLFSQKALNICLRLIKMFNMIIIMQEEFVFYYKQFFNEMKLINFSDKIYKNGFRDLFNQKALNISLHLIKNIYSNNRHERIVCVRL